MNADEAKLFLLTKRDGRGRPDKAWSEKKEIAEKILGKTLKAVREQDELENGKPIATPKIAKPVSDTVTVDTSAIAPTAIPAIVVPAIAPVIETPVESPVVSAVIETVTPVVAVPVVPVPVSVALVSLGDCDRAW